MNKKIKFLIKINYMKDFKINAKKLKQEESFTINTSGNFTQLPTTATATRLSKDYKTIDVRTIDQLTSPILKRHQTINNHFPVYRVSQLKSPTQEKRFTIGSSIFVNEREKNSKMLEKYNEIFDKKKMLFVRSKIPKRIYKTKDGTCHNLTEELKDQTNKIINDRTLYEINQIQKKINFIKSVCDYSYPRIISKQVSMFKKHKSDKVLYKSVPTDVTVSSSEINKTSSFFYQLECDYMNMGDGLNSFRKTKEKAMPLKSIRSVL